MKTASEEVKEMAKVVHNVLGDEICDHYEAITGYTYCEDVAEAIIAAGWRKTDSEEK